MYVEQFFTEGLGCASYLIGSESAGVAAVIDPDRDVRGYIATAHRRGLQITHIIETHLHADHVSGNTDLAEQVDAPIHIHAEAGAAFPHRPLHHGDRIKLGDVHLEVRHTPGHTPESVTLLVTDTIRSEHPWLALTGDTLFVGDVGRPDLVGQEAARQLAGELYNSLFHELSRLDDSVMVYPGHGAGSLCGRAIDSMRSSTLGFERRANPALTLRDQQAFVEYMTQDLPEQPGNHRWIKEINRAGPRPLGEIEPRPLSTRAAVPYFQRRAALIDTRPRPEFIQKHVPGSIHLPLDDQLSNRIGFVLPPDLDIVLLVLDEAAYRQAVLSLARVGFEQVVGYLVEGLAGWEAAGLPVASGDIEDIDVRALNAMMLEGDELQVLDVREPWEYRQGHVPGARLIPLAELVHRYEELDSTRPVAVLCATGNRSQSAAALLGSRQFKKVFNVIGGTVAWVGSGYPSEQI